MLCPLVLGTGKFCGGLLDRRSYSSDSEFWRTFFVSRTSYRVTNGNDCDKDNNDTSSQEERNLVDKLLATLETGSKPKIFLNYPLDHSCRNWAVCLFLAVEQLRRLGRF